MRSVEKKICRDGKSASEVTANLSKIKIKTKSSIIQNDLILQKYLNIISKMKSDNIDKNYEQKLLKVDGIKYKQQVYDLYAASKCGKIIHIKRQRPMREHGTMAHIPSWLSQ